MLGGKGGTHRRPLALVPLRLGSLQFGKLGLEAGQSFLEFRQTLRREAGASHEILHAGNLLLQSQDLRVVGSGLGGVAVLATVGILFIRIQILLNPTRQGAAAAAVPAGQRAQIARLQAGRWAPVGREPAVARARLGFGLSSSLAVKHLIHLTGLTTCSLTFVKPWRTTNKHPASWNLHPTFYPLFKTGHARFATDRGRGLRLGGL